MRKFVAVVLCFAICIASISCIFASSKGTVNVAVLGASQTSGYVLPGFLNEKFNLWTGTSTERLAWEEKGLDADAWDPAGFYGILSTDGSITGYGLFNVVEGALPDLVKKEIERQGYNVNLSQLACAGLRANDLLAFLYDDYVPDVYNEYYFTDLYRNYGSTTAAGFSYLKNIYQESLLGADLIVYDLGAANMGCQLQTWYGEEDTDAELKNLLDEDSYELFSSFREIIKSRIDKLLEGKELDEEALEYYSYQIDHFAYCVMSYCISLDKAMDWIYTNNPDVCVVVTQIQNPMPEVLYYFDGIEIYASDVVSMLASIANTYASSYSKYANKYYYARISDSGRIRMIANDILDYSGPDDITDTLINFCDIYTYNEAQPICKTFFTYAYETGGAVVNDNEYEAALTNAYDTYLKFVQYILNTDYSIHSGSDLYDESFDILNGMFKDLLKESHVSYLNGQSNEAALENAIERFESYDVSYKRVLKLIVVTDMDSMLHPDKQGYMQSAEGVFNALKNNQRGIKSMIKGIKNGTKDFLRASTSLGDTLLSLIQDMSKSNVSINNVPANTVVTIDTVINNAKTVYNQNVKQIKLLELPKLKLK